MPFGAPPTSPLLHPNRVVAPYALTNPAITAVPLTSTSTFTVMQRNIMANFKAVHSTQEADAAGIVWHLYYGPVGSVLTPIHQGDSLAAGVVRQRLGQGSAVRSDISGRFLLSSMVPGQQYAYELAAGVVGGAWADTTAANPFAVAVSQTYTPYPRPSNIVLVRHGASTATVIRTYREAELSDVILGTVTLPATATIGRAAITPDGTKGIVTNQQTHSVTIINTGALTGLAPSIQNSYTVPGTTPAPYAVEVDATGTYAYVVNITSGTMVRVTLADGTMGTPIDLGMGTGIGNMDLALSADGLYAYVAAGTGNKLVKVRLSDNQLTSVALTGATTATLSPDGTTLYAANRTGSPVLGKYRTSDMAFLTSTALAVQPYAAAMFPDGRGMLVVSDTTTVGQQQIQHFRLESGTPVRYVQWVNQLGTQAANNAAYDVSISQNGDIFVPNYSRSALNVWLGGQPVIHTESDFWPDQVTLLFEGAV